MMYDVGSTSSVDFTNLYKNSEDATIFGTPAKSASEQWVVWNVFPSLPFFQAFEIVRKVQTTPNNEVRRTRSNTFFFLRSIEKPALMQRHTTVVPYVQGTKRETKTYKNHQNLVFAVSAWNKQHSYPMLSVCWQWTTAVYNILGWQEFNFEYVHSTESEKQLKSKLHSAYNCFIKYVNICEHYEHLRERHVPLQWHWWGFAKTMQVVSRLTAYKEGITSGSIS